MGAGLLLVGLVVGFLSGMLGIGGGVVLVPALVVLFHFSQQQAQGTTLAVLSVPICAAAAAIYYRNGYIDLSSVVWIVLGFAAGAVAGAAIVPNVPVGLLRRGFGLMLWVTGAGMIFTSMQHRSAAALIGVLLALIARRTSRKPSGGEIEYHI